MKLNKINEDLLNSSISGVNKNFTNSINLINEISNSIRTPIVMIGAVALACYMDKARNTEDIDFITYQSKLTKIMNELDKRRVKYEFKDKSQLRILGNKDLAEVDILLSFTEIDTIPIENYNEIELFNTKTKVTTLEALLILYSISGKLQNKIDGKSILDSNKINKSKFNKLLLMLEPSDRNYISKELDKIRNISDKNYNESRNNIVKYKYIDDKVKFNKIKNILYSQFNKEFERLKDA